jgi:hypothetical protein
VTPALLIPVITFSRFPRRHKEYTGMFNIFTPPRNAALPPVTKQKARLQAAGVALGSVEIAVYL